MLVLERPLVLAPATLPAAATRPSLTLQVEYLLKKVLSSMSLEVGLGELEELLAQEAQAAQSSSGLSVWQFLELFNSGRCLRGVGRDTLSMAIHEVYQELIQDVLKQVRPSWEQGEDPREGRRGARHASDFALAGRATCGSEDTCGGTGQNAGSSCSPAASAILGVKIARRKGVPSHWMRNAAWR